MDKSVILLGMIFVLFHASPISSAPTFGIEFINAHDSNSRLVKRAFSDLPESQLWPNAVIPYRIESDVSHLTCLIESAMFHIMQSTCIHFRPKLPQDRHYLQVTRGDGGCWAYPGYKTFSRLFPQTPMGLGPNRCENFVAVVHELMHVVGFEHEHSRFDRDKYVKINNQSIMPDKVSNFQVLPKFPGRNITEFDFDSIMLYSSNHFSIDNKSLTIESIIPGKPVPDVWNKPGLSKLDVKSVNMLYKCDLIQGDSNACAKLDQLRKHTQQCRTKHSAHFNSIDLAISFNDQCKSLKNNASKDTFLNPLIFILAAMMMHLKFNLILLY